MVINVIKMYRYNFWGESGTNVFIKNRSTFNIRKVMVKNLIFMILIFNLVDLNHNYLYVKRI